MAVRKTAINTPASMMETVNKALTSDITVPSCIQLRPEDMPFWNALIRARAKSEWKEHELILVAQLARCQYDIEVEQSLIYVEGTTIRNDKGTQITNPRFGSICRLKEMQLSTLKALSLHTGAGVEKRTLNKRTSIAQQTEDAVGNVLENDDDDLIARPTVQ